MSHLKRPSPALVISIMALVAALAVPAYAALSKGEKKTVKKLANAQITKRAPGLAVASAKSANTAGNANTVDGQDASDFAPAGSEAFQAMTLNDGGGQLDCYWVNVGTGLNNAAYFRDSAGVVHLKGVVKAVDGAADACFLNLSSFFRIATLPVGYRPDAQSVFPTVSNNQPGRVDVKATGDVEIASSFPEWPDAMVNVSLDGISFRCAPSGSNGCP